MQQTQPDTALAGGDVTLFGAVLKYWWVVALVTLAFGALGFALASSQPVTYEATATVLIKDPRAADSALGNADGGTNQSSERHLADQVEILRSVEVSQRAAVSLDDGTSAAKVTKATSVTGDLTSNLIVVTYSASSAEKAKAGADAVAMAYIQLMEDQSSDQATAEAAGIDALIVSADERLVVIQTSLDDATQITEERAELERQLQEAQEELNETRRLRDQAPIGSEQRIALNARIDELVRDFAAWDALLRIETQNDEVAVLIASRDALLAERAGLVAQRDALLIAAANPESGVLLFSPAEEPDSPAGLPPMLILIAFVVLGVAMGAAVAYGLAVRKTNVSDGLEAESLLDAPLIVDVPAGSTSDRTTPIPILQAPETQRAEAFRFLSVAIGSQQQRAISAGHAPAKVLAFASAVDNELRASATANTAVAMAQEGQRVLVMDADLQRQTVTKMLLRNAEPTVGLVDVLEHGASLEGTILPLNSIGGVEGGLSVRGSVSLLARGSEAESTSFIASQEALLDLVHEVADDFDLVFIDCPPLLRVAYATQVLETADASLAIIEQGQHVGDVRSFALQLTAASTPIVGYVFDRARGRALVY